MPTQAERDKKAAGTVKSVEISTTTLTLTNGAGRVPSHRENFKIDYRQRTTETTASNKNYLGSPNDKLTLMVNTADRTVSFYPTTDTFILGGTYNIIKAIDNDSKVFITSQPGVTINYPRALVLRSLGDFVQLKYMGANVWDVLSTNLKKRVPKELNIGNWDMTSTFNVLIPHGLSATEWKTIKDIGVEIRNDDDTNYITPWVEITVVKDATNLDLQRVASDRFDSADFDTSTGYNRGTVRFTYIPD